MLPLVNIAPGAYLYLALLLLTLPLPWLTASLGAAFIHEISHWVCVYICGGRIIRLQADIGGFVLETTPLSPGQELLCTLAGPAGSLVLLFSLSWFPRLALCGLVQGLFNLMPLYPFDGGRILRCGASLLFHEKTVASICKWAEAVFLALLTILGICFRLGALSFLFPLFLWLRTKIPCKTGPVRIQ